MKTVQDIADLKNKKILLRVDFAVPVDEKGQIQEPFRIKKQKEMLDWLIEHGAQVVMAGHLHNAEDSFSEMVQQLHILLGYEIGFIKNIEDISGYLEDYSAPGLLENTKSFDGEEDGSKDLAKKLASGFDIYINNAFATCHRNYASISTIASLLPSYAGLTVQEEVKRLSEILDAPAMGKVIIIGGAKASTKVPVIKNFLDKAEHILLGGVVANDVLKEKGQDMGSSVVDAEAKELLAGLDLADPRLVVPKDFIIFDNKILDIGDETMRHYLEIIGHSKMIIWNGPMGLFENPVFAKGTNEVAQAIAATAGQTIIGGGDTISAVDKIGLLDKFGFVSTGGGAMLAFLAGQPMLGLEALK